jgi:hypothetical protein
LEGRDGQKKRYNDDVMYLLGVRVERILDIAFSHHSKMADCLDGNRSKKVVL